MDTANARLMNPARRTSVMVRFNYLLPDYVAKVSYFIVIHVNAKYVTRNFD